MTGHVYVDRRGMARPEMAAMMESVLESGVAQLISLCRPLIVEPDLPNKLRMGISDRAACACCGQCWPNDFGEGIACHNRAVRKRLALSA